jgi:hypothetical protein
MTGQAATKTNTIEVRLSSIDQLFNTLDPSPFREKDLDKEVEEFIVSWARELPTDLPFTILVHLPEKQLARAEAKEVGPAITGFFGYSAQEIGLELKELFRVGPARLPSVSRFSSFQSLRARWWPTTSSLALSERYSRKALSSLLESLSGGRSRSSFTTGGRSLGAAVFVRGLRQRRSSSSPINRASHETLLSGRMSDMRPKRRGAVKVRAQPPRPALAQPAPPQERSVLPPSAQCAVRSD